MAIPLHLGVPTFVNTEHYSMIALRCFRLLFTPKEASGEYSLHSQDNTSEFALLLWIMCMSNILIGNIIAWATSC